MHAQLPIGTLIEYEPFSPLLYRTNSDMYKPEEALKVNIIKNEWMAMPSGMTNGGIKTLHLEYHSAGANE